MRLTDKFVCIACDFSTDFSSVYDRHLVTKKHFKNSKKSKKQQEKYVCTCCDFFTFKKSNFDRHNLTLKHMTLLMLMIILQTTDLHLKLLVNIFAMLN